MRHEPVIDRSAVPRTLRLLIPGVFAIALTGCAGWLTQWEEPRPAAEEPVAEQPAAEPAPAPVQPVPKPAPTAKRKPAPPPPEPDIAIVLSDDIPPYVGVARELERLLEGEDYSLHKLDGSFPTAEAIFDEIEATDTPYVIAIGFNAARLASQLSDAPVIFCQVFNFQKTDFHPDRVRGISAVPPLDLQLQAWKELDPNLKSVGAILGEGHHELIAAAGDAAAKESMDLHYRVARSDRETLYLFKRLAASIDGFWLFPDNRVLSPTVIDQISMFASRHRIQVTVFIPSMLKLGAIMSASSVNSDIARTVLSVLKRASMRGMNSVPTITLLSDIEIRFNDGAAARFGLTVPVDNKHHLSAR